MTELVVWYAGEIEQRVKDPIGQLFEDGDGNTLEAYTDETKKSAYLKDQKPVESENGPIAEIEWCRRVYPEKELMAAIGESENLDELKDKIKQKRQQSESNE